MNQFEHKVLRFDRFALDLGRGCLRSGEQVINLRPKSFQVLTHLAVNAGRMVPKQELIEAVWPDVTVTDESLVQCIRELRQKLGDDEHRLIKTLPRRGYLLDATLAPADAAHSPARRAGLPQELLGLVIRLLPPHRVVGKLHARKSLILLAAGLASALLAAAYLLLQIGEPAATAGRAHGLPQPSPVSELFTEDDAKRVAAVAAGKQLPLPAFQIVKPAPDVAKDARRFVGVWVSGAGWIGSGRQLMLIVASVDRDGVAEGYIVDGPPQPTSYEQSPALAASFKAKISGRGLSYASGKGEHYVSLTMQNRIEFKLKRRNGTSGVVSLDPVWTLADAERAGSASARRPD